jgi:2-polyprenyl-3-methyl-5-hydroxy-6-metoxy-1,4-benzoquinol methylase
MTQQEKMSTCPICSGVGRPAFIAKDYEFSKCQGKDCGHVYVDPMPTSNELGVFYATNTSGLENSDSWTMVDDYENNPRLVHKFYEGNRIKFLRKQGLLHPHTNVLDVGCSTGMFLRVLMDQGCQNVVGVDLSLEQVTHCRDVNKIRAFRELSEIPLGENFDLVSLYAVLEHVPNPVEVLQQSVRRLRHGGHLIIDVPNYRSVYRLLSGKKWLWLIPPVHLQYFTPKSMEKLAMNAGLEISYSSTKSTSTYTYIMAYHLFDLFKRELPSTSLAASRLRSLVVSCAELSMRVLFAPLSVLMRLSRTHNQIIYIFRRKE